MPRSLSECQVELGCSCLEFPLTTSACTKSCQPPSFEECLPTAWTDHRSRDSCLQLRGGREREKYTQGERERESKGIRLKVGSSSLFYTHIRSKYQYTDIIHIITLSIALQI